MYFNFEISDTFYLVRREPKHSVRALWLWLWFGQSLKKRVVPKWFWLLPSPIVNSMFQLLVNLQPASETAIPWTFSKWFWLAQSSKLAWGRRQFRFAMVGWSGWEVWVGGCQGGRANIATTSSSSAPQSREEPPGLKVLCASHLNSHLKRTMCVRVSGSGTLYSLQPRLQFILGHRS